jgi:predicted amidophosphoribosyltransferase
VDQSIHSAAHERPHQKAREQQLPEIRQEDQNAHCEDSANKPSEAGLAVFHMVSMQRSAINNKKFDDTRQIAKHLKRYMRYRTRENHKKALNENSQAGLG